MGRTLEEYKAEITVIRKRILDTFLSNYPGKDISKIEQAMDYAELLHRGQLRRNGIPYIFHPLNVAELVTKAQMDDSSLISALLHDTIEDTVATKGTITKKFGPVIADFVQALTKIRSFSNEASDKDDKWLTYQRILKAASKDIRPLLVKIFDRLANMRDMEHMPEGHQKRISKETLNVYVPLARRLGMSTIYEELTDLSLRYIYPENYQLICDKIDKHKLTRKDDIDEIQSTVTSLCKKHSINNEIFTNWPIMADFFEQEFGLNVQKDIEVDISLVIDDLIQIYTCLGIIHSLYTPVPLAVRDKIANPMANGYRALETRVVIKGRIHHFSIMTHEMKEVNEQGIIHNWKLNKSRLSGYYTSYMNLLGELLADQDIRVDDVLNQSQVEGIAIFSPRKDLYVLPPNSTVLDFAYTVHKQIGEHAKEAYVNGILRPIYHKLQTGDVVEIVTDAKIQPEESWLNIAVTSKAQSSIKTTLKKRVDQRAVELGKEMLYNELSRYGRDPKVILESPEFKKILSDRNVTLDSILRKIGFRKVAASDFIYQYKMVPLEKIRKQKKAERASIREKLFSSLSNRKGKAYKFTKNDIFIKYANCCNPIFGDKVGGIVSEGKGIIVHRISCPNLKNIDKSQLVEVEWDLEENLSSAVLNLHVNDQQGVLASVLIAVKKLGINMSEFNAYTIGHEAFMKIRLDVSNHRELIKVVNEIRKLDAIISITREE